MTGFFEVITISAPHIYHSALLLSPQTSITRTLYGSQANPLVRVIQGIPTSWDPCTGNTKVSSSITHAVWSPCGKFLAIGRRHGIEILDAVTLEQHCTMHPNCKLVPSALIFSPDGRLLTAHDYSDKPPHNIVTWDIQTGGVINCISAGDDLGSVCSLSYSECGKMVGVLFKRMNPSQATDADGYIIDTYTYSIVIYNLLSGTCISSHLVQEPITLTTWTHGEHIQFTAIKSESIIIWEIGFVSSCTPTEVGTLPIPDNFPEDPSGKNLLLFPDLSQFAFFLGQRVLVWDVQNHKSLLDSEDIVDPKNMTFSPDGHFFLCGGNDPEFYLWKKSPSGYHLHRKLVSGIGWVRYIISPNGMVIVGLWHGIIQQWHITNASLPNISTQTPKRAQYGFVLDFSPDGKLVAVAQHSDKTVIVLDLKSGKPQLVIDTSMVIQAIKVTGGKVVVVDDGKVVTWDLPAGGCALNIRADINNGIQIATFKESVNYGSMSGLPISPDLNYLATSTSSHLHIHDMHTGRILISAESHGSVHGFTPDGYAIWDAMLDPGHRGGSKYDIRSWNITKNKITGTVGLQPQGFIKDLPGGFPWQSSCGYQVTNDWWILSPTGKQLLWLPHQWRSSQGVRGMMVWSGRFLALFHPEVTDAVILELEV